MPAPDLREQLQSFAAAVDASSLDAADVAVFAGDPGLARRRLGIYRGNVRHNLARALRNAYPVIAALVGDAFFDGLAAAFAGAKPPAGGNLDEAGAGFAAFLDGFPHTAQIPYLPDVARLEWLVHRAHMACDAPPFDRDALGRVPAALLAAAHPRLAPACALLASSWPVVTIWRVHQSGHEGGVHADLDVGERALVTRTHWRVGVAALSAPGFAFLAGCADGASFATAVEAALAQDAGFGLAPQLRTWVEAGVIVAIDVRAAGA